MHGNRYGSPRAPIDRALAEGRDVLFDIDWQGARDVAEKVDDMQADVRRRIAADPKGALDPDTLRELERYFARQSRSSSAR